MDNTKDSYRVELINKVLDIDKEMNLLWQFHPDNPFRREIELSYEKLVEEKYEIESLISELGISSF
jgi:hypothetical protein